MSRADVLAHALRLIRSGQGASAIKALTPIVQGDPSDSDAAQLMGLAVLASGSPRDALPHFRRAAELDPQAEEKGSNYAAALNRAGRHAEAVAEYRRVLARYPDSYAANLGISGALGATMDFEASVAAAERAVRLSPGEPAPWVNMSIAYSRAGHADKAVAVARQGLAAHAGFSLLHTQVAANLHYLPGLDPAEVRAEHERLGAILTRAAGSGAPARFSNLRDAERPLRVGYVSPDFREHSIMHFFRPLIAAHDPARVKVFCYSAVSTPDAMTESIRPRAFKWRDIAWTADGALADLVRGDQIDILVDLAGHTAAGRLPAMARRLAPVQVNYLGYAGTTGVAAIDYRIVDSITDPPGAERFATEKLVRLDPCFLCYQPPTGPDGTCPDGGGASSERRADRPFTFGSFNTITKVSDTLLRTWSRILGAAPGSRLLLKMQALDSDAVRADMLRRLGAAGVSADRVDLLGWQAERGAHLSHYGRVDLALDTLPYNGTTTTCEALWMGVPVVTVAGDSHAARVGASLLNAVGVGELVAPSEDAYVELAAALAASTDRLGALRRGLRERLLASPLCDARGHAARIESAYREMWRAYCQSSG